MTEINKLVQVDALASGDLLDMWSQANGSEMSVSLTTLQNFLNETLSVGKLVTQYAAPLATGFSVTIPATDRFLILTPAAGYAAGTIVLPVGIDRSEILVVCTQAVTALTITGGTVVGAPTTLAANAFFRLRYDGTLARWYRIG